MTGTRQEENIWLRRLGHIALGGCAIFIWLTWIDRPDPPDRGLDPSWQAVLGIAHFEGLKFGREIIFTHGPWGWLTSHFLMDDGLTGKWVWEVFGKLLLATGLVVVSRKLPLTRRVPFLILLPAVGLFFPDTHFVAAIYLAVVVGLMSESPSRATIVLAAGAIGFLSTMKFVYAVLGLSGVALAAAGHLWKREWRVAVEMVASVAVSFIVAWLLSGQSLLALFGHVRMSLELSSGYSGAMAFDEPTSFFVAGSMAVLAILAGCGLAIRSADRQTRWRVVPASVFLAFATFGMWKHGFSRADGHVFALFNHAILVGLCGMPALGLRKKFDVLLLASAAGAAGVLLWDTSFVLNAPGFLSARLRPGADYVLRPHKLREAFQASLAARQREASIPALRDTVGQRPVDMVNYEQSLLLLNELNYHGRPVFQSYAAYTPTLLRRNLRFFQRPEAPEFLLWQQGTIDGRFPSQDDSLAVLEIPRRYEPVQETSAGLLLKRRATPPAERDPQWEEVTARHVQWGEAFELPPAPDCVLWFEVRCFPSFVGRLRAALYKPGQVNMVVLDSLGRTTTHRLIPAISEVGFIVHPFLDAQEDVNLFAAGKARMSIRSVRFEPAQPDEKELWAGVHVRLYRVPELALKEAAPFGEYVRMGLMNFAPIKVTSSVGVHMISDESPRKLLVHPAGEMVFEIDAAHRCVSGSYGIREQAYTNGASTDGVAFAIQAEDAAGQRSEIWRNSLHPLADAGDRGLHHFDVCAPEGTVRLVFRTDAGEQGNTDWDWAYWTSLEFGP